MKDNKQAEGTVEEKAALKSPLEIEEGQATTSTQVRPAVKRSREHIAFVGAVCFLSCVAVGVGLLHLGLTVLREHVRDDSTANPSDSLSDLRMARGWLTWGTPQTGSTGTGT